MKLHEALSTGLSFRSTEADKDNWITASFLDEWGIEQNSWSTKDVMTTEWQVRLPSGVVVEEYKSYLYLVNTNVAIDTSGLKAEASSLSFKDLYKDTDIKGLTFDGVSDLFCGTKCECGSEAIGGGSHSTWCAKHE